MSNEKQTNDKQENVQTYELTTNITKKDVATAFVIVFMLLAAALGISSCINKGNEHKIEKLKQAMRELEWEKEDKICDSLYQVTDIRREAFNKDPENIDKRIQERIDDANQEIEYLRGEAVQPILKKYPLTQFFSPKELAQINEDITARATSCIDNDMIGMIIDQSVNAKLPFEKTDFMTYGIIGADLKDNPLDKKESVYHFENRMHQLDYLERRPSKPNFDAYIADERFYVQVPNENPSASMRDGKLSFTNPASQKLYEQYQEAISNIDQKYIFTNPKLASRYCEYSKALNQAYKDREKLREISKYFDKQYQPQIDSLNYELIKLQGQKR